MMEVESARSAAVESGNWLKAAVIECLKSPVCSTEQRDWESCRRKELLETFDTAKAALERVCISVGKQLLQLEKECRKLKRDTEDLSLAQGEKTEELKALRESYIAQKQKNETDLVQCETELKAIGDLPFENWKAAAEERDKAAVEAAGIFAAIEEAVKNRQDADQKAAELRASISTLKENLSAQ